MKKRTFSVLHVGHLTNDNTHTLFESTLKVTNPMISHMCKSVEAVFLEFAAAAHDYGLQLNARRKSRFTEQVRMLDRKNDDLLAEMKRTVVFMSRSHDLNVQEAAQELDFFFVPYWGAAKKQINAQAEELAGMFEKFYADPDLKEAADLVEITGLLFELEASNASLVSILMGQSKESEEHLEVTSDLRSASVGSYVRFCSVVEQVVNDTPNEQLIGLFDTLEAIRRHYSTLPKPERSNITDV